jgi:predicted nuclease of predicted toxin-antitoxin system
MKVLLDTYVSGALVLTLSEAGHDVVWTGDWERDPGDAEILSHAYREGRVLVTLDKDFGTLVVLHGQPHAGILRLVNLSTREQDLVVRQVLAEHADELMAGGIITAERHRLRIRRPG